MNIDIRSGKVSFNPFEQMINAFLPRNAKKILKKVDKGIDDPAALVKDQIAEVAASKVNAPKQLAKNASPFTGKNPLPFKSFAKGAEIKRTQVAKIHRGELVVKAGQAKAVKSAMKKAGIPVPKPEKFTNIKVRPDQLTPRPRPTPAAKPNRSHGHMARGH